MGMNYYIKKEKCQSCGHQPEQIHLGKSSWGWRFKFQYNHGDYYSDIDELKKWLVGKKIVDEDGEEIDHKKFWAMVEDHQKERIEGYGALLDGYEFIDGEFS